MYDVEGEPDVVICGCLSGEDFEVLHLPSERGVSVRSGDGREWTIGWPEWRSAVYGFADRVSEFYTACTPKQPTSEDRPGFAKFAAEWERRRGGTERPNRRWSGFILPREWKR
jgi:hypothetical protein